MADMLGIASQAANTFKRAIEVTSHNVANVGTEGYSRQNVLISSNTPQMVSSNNFLGSGSRVDGVQRSYAGYIHDQMVSSGSLLARYDEQLQLAKQVEGVIASNDEGVQEFMQRFFDSLQNLADNPTSQTNKQMVLDEASNLETNIQNINAVLTDTQLAVNDLIVDNVKEVNDRLDIIRQINVQVNRATISDAAPPNELLDQRDQAIKELSEYIDVKTYDQPNGQVDVYIGNGKIPLLSDNSITKIDPKLSDFRAENRIEMFMNIGGQEQEISQYLTGGKLGGAIDFRDNMLDDALNDTGVMLNGMVASVNWQHYQGYDIDGNPGGHFFNPSEVTPLANINNSGVIQDSDFTVQFNPNTNAANTGTESLPPYSTNVSAVSPPAFINDQPSTYGEKLAYLDNAMSEIGNFKAREYLVRFDHGSDSFEVLDNNSNQSLAVIPRGQVQQVDGFAFDFTTTPAFSANESGDSFLVTPHKDILTNFSRSISEPQDIATRGQSPVDASGVNGLDDEPPAAAAEGDNVNVANIAGLNSKKVLFADSSGQAAESLLGGYSKMATNVGMYVRGTEIQFDSQTSVYQSIFERREGVSGVNLDEEAGNLIRFQQAYQASAQIIQTSQTLFQTLIGAVRG